MTPGLREKRLARGRFWRTGFTQEMVAEYLAKQNNRCAVCQREFSDKVKYQADHCHDTKKPRGLLCFHCNIIEGKLLAIGMKPLEFGESLHKYLESSVGIMAK